MERLARKVLGARVPIIIVTVLLTVVLGYGLARVTINSDIISYLKRGDPAVALFNRIGEEYGGNLTIYTIVRSDDIFDRELLSFIHTLTELYRRIEGVSSVTSLTNIIDIKGSKSGIEIGALIPPGEVPSDPERLSELESYVRSTDLYRGKVVSEDGSASVIVSHMNPKYNRIAVAMELIARTREVKGGRTVQFTGYPVQMAELSRFLSNDLGRLIPIVVVVIVATLFVSFRTGRGILLPLSIVLISTVWTLGIMGFCRIPLTIMSNIVPVVLLAVGTAYGIHFIARYCEDVTVEESKIDGIALTLSTVGVPILLAGITTILGFLSFAGAYLTAITEFGIFTALGVFFAMTLSLTFTPAVLSFMKVKRVSKKKGGNPRFASVMQTAGLFVVRRARLVVIVTAAVALITLFAFPRIEIATQLTNYFPSKSEIRRAEATIKEQFGGSTPFQIVVKGDLGNPAVLSELYQTEKYLGSVPGVHNTQSVADLVCRMNELLNGRKTVPETREELANLLFMLEGQEILEQLVQKGYQEGVIQAVFGEENAGERDKAVDRIRSYLESTNRDGIAVIRMEGLPAGDRSRVEGAVLSEMADAIVYDMKPFAGLEAETVRRALEGTVKDLRNSLAAPERESLERELDTYFKEESELWIDDNGDRARVVTGVLAEFSSKRPDSRSMREVLKSGVPPKYWKNAPEAVESAADHLAARIREAQGKSFVVSWSEKLLESLLPGFTANEKVETIVRNDLWPYIEDTAKVPAATLTGKEGVLDEPGFSAELGGMLVVLTRLDRYLLKSQVQSVVLALLTVFLLLWFQFKSIRMGIVTLSPIFLVILFNFAILGFLNIPLDYATMLVASILIGVGIDYSIHFTSRYNLELTRRLDRKEAIVRTLGTTGTAIVINAAMVAFGFFVLTGGNLIPIRRAGWITGSLMLLSAFAALAYLPAALTLWGGIHKKRDDHGTRRPI
jgi:predicted RND superfamily exporter protein